MSSNLYPKKPKSNNINDLNNQTPECYIKAYNGLQIQGDGTQKNPYKIGIDDEENIGIGDFSKTPVPPSEKLDVNGNIRIRSLPEGSKRDDYVVISNEGSLRRITEHAPRVMTILETSQVTTTLNERTDLFINTDYSASDGYKRQVYLPYRPADGKIIYLKKSGDYTNDADAYRMTVFNSSGKRLSDVLAGETVMMVHLGSDRWLRLMTSRNYS